MQLGLGSAFLSHTHALCHSTPAGSSGARALTKTTQEGVEEFEKALVAKQESRELVEPVSTTLVVAACLGWFVAGFCAALAITDRRELRGVSEQRSLSSPQCDSCPNDGVGIRCDGDSMGEPHFKQLLGDWYDYHGTCLLSNSACVCVALVVSLIYFNALQESATWF